MARFHFISTGDAMFLALRLKQEGHKVTWHPLPPCPPTLGRGLLERSIAPPKGAIVVFDGVGEGRRGAALRKQGFAVIGGNPLDKQLELDRTRGSRIMEQLGILVPETKSFDSIGKAIKFLEADADPKATWYFKPNGPDLNKMLTHSDQSIEGMTSFLRWAEPKLSAIKSFELQKGIKGIEISTNGWFDGRRFVPPFDATIEDKRLMTGDLGPRTGCQANVVWLWPLGSLLPDITVARITQQLAAEGYVGPIDLNTIIADDDGEPYGLEWTARMGFDATQAWTMLLTRGTIGDQLAAFANRELTQWEGHADRLALTLRVTVPPYPAASLEANEHSGEEFDPVGMPLGRDLLKHDWFMPYGIMEGDEGPALGAGDGTVGVVGVVGHSIERMRRSVLTHAEDLHLPSGQWRTDPVARTEKVWRRMRELKLIEGATPV